MTKISDEERKRLRDSAKNVSYINTARAGTASFSDTQGSRKSVLPSPADVEPDWATECTACGSTPTVPITGLCGPCTFGDASTAGGKW